jgi:hypothetical protein
LFPRLRTLAVTAALATLASGAAWATQMVHLDTRRLTLASSEIVIGEVESVRPRWNDARTKIYTDVTVKVSRALKGPATERVVLTQLGGEVDGVRVTVPGCPAFTPGEEALFFVWRDARGRAQVNGLGQGKFEILRDPASGRRLVQRAVPGLGVQDPRTLKAAPEGQPAPQVALDDLVSEIERTLAEGGR